MNIYTNRTVLESLGLPIFENVKTLAEATRLSEKLIYYLSKKDAPNRYTEYYIPKRDGSKRKICEPCYSLRILQRWVLENILYKVKVSQYSIGFKRGSKGSPLVQSAEKHRKNLYILKMDLKDFYPSISSDRVFRQFSQLGYNVYAANMLTNICALHGCLPQGAVTSAYLANLICARMDYRIAGYCNKRNIAYSRYADDLTFSSDNRDEVRNIYGMIKKIVTDEGFTVNEKKTHFLTPKNHKEILGITVNDEMIKAPKDMKRMVRSMIHYSVVSGDYSNNNKIRGYISYISSIEKTYPEKVKKYMKKFNFDMVNTDPALVDAFNANKLFNDLPDMRVRSIYDFVDAKDAGDAKSYKDCCEYYRDQFVSEYKKKH